MLDNIFNYRECALGVKKSRYLLTNCKLVNVLSGKVENNASIAIAGRRIVGIGDYQADEVIDLKGQYVYPGLMDSHIHLESTKMTIPECARVMSRFGTTAVFTDPHEIANVASVEGVSFQLDTSKYNERMSVFFTVPSCVPALPDPEIETFAAYMGPTKLKTFFNNRWFVVLGEMMNMPGVIYGDKKVLAKIDAFREKGLPIDGHAPMLRGKELNTYIYLGIRSDHESTSAEEAQEKLDRGMHIMIREGSTESNLLDLLPVITPLSSPRLMFASDDIDPVDLVERGHINYILKTAVANGIDPMMALQMATINVANYFRLRDSGAIFPGAWADLVVAPDLKDFMPTSVMRGGQFIFRDGKELQVGTKIDRYLRSMMNVTLPAIEGIKVPDQPGKKIRVIEIIENQIVTNEKIIEPDRKDGCVIADADKDIAKVCVFERHRNSESFAVGFIKGLGLKRGAIGSSVAHDSHNIIVAGIDDESIMAVARRIAELNGGQVAACVNGMAEIPLPIAGLMSDKSYEVVAAQEKAFGQFCSRELGSKLKSPISTLSFMALPVIPLLKITDKGLFRIDTGEYPVKVSLFV